MNGLTEVKEVKNVERGRGVRRAAGASLDSEVLDLQGLLDRCLGNLDLVERLLERFEQWLPAELAELEQALALEDRERMARAAHRIKGSSANISALGIQRAAAEIVQRSRCGHAADLRACVDQLRSQWTQYLAASASTPAAAGIP